MSSFPFKLNTVSASSSRRLAITFGSKRRASLYYSPILEYIASFMHLLVRPLVLSPIICRYFALPIPYYPFYLPIYSVSRRSLILAFHYNFRYYLLNLLSYFGLAFILLIYRINPYSNKRILYILKPRHRGSQGYHSRRATIFAEGIRISETGGFMFFYDRQ